MGHEKGALPSRTAPTNLLALDEEGMGRLVQQLDGPATEPVRFYAGLSTSSQRHQPDDGPRPSGANGAGSRATIPRAAGCTVFRSIDHTRKLVLTLNDGLTVETVLIPMKTLNPLCINAGRLYPGLRICLTGTMGLKRNLRHMKSWSRC